MTDAEIRIYLLEWVNAYCGQAFEEPLPGAITLFLYLATKHMKTSIGKTSEALGDYSVSYNTDFPPTLLDLLLPYRTLKAPQ